MSAELALPPPSIDIATDPNALVDLNSPLFLIGGDARGLIVQMTLLRDGSLTPTSVARALQEAVPRTELDIPALATKLAGPVRGMCNAQRAYLQHSHSHHDYRGSPEGERIAPLIGLQAARSILYPAETALIYPYGAKNMQTYGDRLAVLQALLKPRPTWQLLHMLTIRDNPTSSDQACAAARKTLLSQELVVPLPEPGQATWYAVDFGHRDLVAQVTGELHSLSDTDFADKLRITANQIAHDPVLFGSLAQAALGRIYPGQTYQ